MDYKQLVARIWNDGFNKGDLRAIDDVLAPNWVSHDPYISAMGSGPSALKNFVTTYRKAFSDLRMNVDQQIADGDYVVTRWSSTGTHDGDFLGNPPTNKKGRVDGITIHRIQNGKVVETWNQWDILGMFNQLGIQPRNLPGMTGKRGEARP